MHLIIGLGNPGTKYENTRHNLGFKVIDELALRLNIKKFKSRCRSNVAETKIDDHKIILAQPQTFMNNSGEALAELFSWYKINPSKLILIYDDVDLEVGQIRIRNKGGAGGHHGAESILKYAKSSEFARVRIGIGKEEKIETADYVLLKIPFSQSEDLAASATKAAEAVELIIKSNLEAAMNKFNT
ncbi:MAG: aminoacyl-tRNA hydrolase [Candidatus Saganbacteria bacterium]|nr:aminoacyl-tRNA hydrolase [Candidatus Saganbacteria bacterium]